MHLVVLAHEVHQETLAQIIRVLHTFVDERVRLTVVPELFLKETVLVDQTDDRLFQSSFIQLLPLDGIVPVFVPRRDFSFKSSVVTTAAARAH